MHNILVYNYQHSHLLIRNVERQGVTIEQRADGIYVVGKVLETALFSIQIIYARLAFLEQLDASSRKKEQTLTKNGSLNRLLPRALTATTSRL
jgi:hypothetical protein